MGFRTKDDEQEYNNKYYQENQVKIRAKARKYYHANRERDSLRKKEKYQETKDEIWAGHIKRKYGITHEDYAEMVAHQDSKCAVCGDREPGGRGRWHIDHCHETDEVRGLLCSRCNIGLGQFRDNVAFLKSAIKYLENR